MDLFWWSDLAESADHGPQKQSRWRCRFVCQRHFFLLSWSCALGEVAPPGRPWTEKDESMEKPVQSAIGISFSSHGPAPSARSLHLEDHGPRKMSRWRSRSVRHRHFFLLSGSCALGEAAPPGRPWTEKDEPLEKPFRPPSTHFRPSWSCALGEAAPPGRPRHLEDRATGALDCVQPAAALVPQPAAGERSFRKVEGTLLACSESTPGQQAGRCNRQQAARSPRASPKISEVFEQPLKLSSYSGDEVLQVVLPRWHLLRCHLFFPRD